MATYIFPDILAKTMSKIDLRTQLEASMMSMSLMMIGLFITALYIGFYASFPIWYKVVLEINFLAGLIFMMSFLITTFQQYQNYMEVAVFQEDLKGEGTIN